ncbi:hypothetical protein [Dendrosporobacter sp. 1207_IL3150]|uniref:hypothetical protein n=1 Tax=Dendrosporobacter sp. 1207_IL3150 TaxID=3084054 RepID=UPI002FD9975A
MSKKQQILNEIKLDNHYESLNEVFEKLDNYQVDLPSHEDSKRLLLTLKPILAANIQREPGKIRFKEMMEANRVSVHKPEILQLIRLQSTLINKRFLFVTSILLIACIVLVRYYDISTSKFLVTLSPVLGILTFYYEYRAQIYKVEEIEAVCRYSRAQLALARIMVVVGYNLLFLTCLTFIINSSFSIAILKLIMDCLTPLLLSLGIALASSLKFGIAGGCMTAGIVWIIQITLLKGDFIFRFLLPNMTEAANNIVGIAFGLALIYHSVRRLAFR